VFHILCNSISRVQNSILFLQTGSVENAENSSITYPLDTDELRKSFESYGIHRSRLVFFHRHSLSEVAGLMMGAAAAAAADVVVDFSASSLVSLSVAAPV
jgi:predicted O-linked N-acetylglucosamine transferase (SPINDLY family)